MKVSFLVTYYNQKEYVKNSLDSIIAIKKNFQWEILVGDDGSTDGTVDIVKEYIIRFPDKIKLFVMPREKNVLYDSVKRASENRLNLLKQCTGDYYCILDGDDFYIDIDFVAEALALFQQNRQIAVVGFGYCNYCDGFEVQKTLLSKRGTGIIKKEQYLRQYYTHAGACLFKICWGVERINYIENVGFFDDNDILINALNYGDLMYVDRVIYAYRQTEISVYNSMDVAERLVLNLMGYDIDKKLIKNCHRDLLVRYGYNLLVLYLNRSKLPKLLGTVKTEKYARLTKNIDNSLCNIIINWKIVNYNRKTVFLKELFLYAVKTPQSVLKVLFKYSINDEETRLM